MKIGFTKLNTLRQLLGYFSIDLYRPHQVNPGPQIGETKLRFQKYSKIE